jgi:hypothetical protein
MILMPYRIMIGLELKETSKSFYFNAGHGVRDGGAGLTLPGVRRSPASPKLPKPTHSSSPCKFVRFSPERKPFGIAQSPPCLR